MFECGFDNWQQLSLLRVHRENIKNKLISYGLKPGSHYRIYKETPCNVNGKWIVSKQHYSNRAKYLLRIIDDQIEQLLERMAE